MTESPARIVGVFQAYRGPGNWGHVVDEPTRRRRARGRRRARADPARRPHAAHGPRGRGPPRDHSEFAASSPEIHTLCTMMSVRARCYRPAASMAEHDPRAVRPDAHSSPLRGARDLPHSLEAEQAVLGAILLEETAFDQVAPLLKADDFYLLAHQHVYAVCEELARESKTLDPVLAQQRLDAKGLLGTRSRTSCRSRSRAPSAPPRTSPHYAHVVRDLARLRQMMLTAQRDGGARLRGRRERPGVPRRPQQEVFGAAQGTTARRCRLIQEPMIRAIENLEAVQKRVQAGLSPITGVPTGIQSLDKNTPRPPARRAHRARRAPVGRQDRLRAQHRDARGDARPRRWSRSSRSRCPPSSSRSACSPPRRSSTGAGSPRAVSQPTTGTRSAPRRPLGRAPDLARRQLRALARSSSARSAAS